MHHGLFVSCVSWAKEAMFVRVHALAVVLLWLFFRFMMMGKCVFHGKWKADEKFKAWIALKFSEVAVKWKVSLVTGKISLDYSNTHSFPLFGCLFFSYFYFCFLFSCFAFWCSALYYLLGMISNLSMLNTSFKMIADDCSKNNDNSRAYIWGSVNIRKSHKNRRKFTTTFSIFPFTSSFSGCCWISLSHYAGSTDWKVETAINLAPRSDNGKINSSPVTRSPAIVRFPGGCRQSFRIPVEDPDGDTVKCRSATHSESVIVNASFPYGELDEVIKSRSDR